MFRNLPESRSRTQFRIGGSVASLTAHAMIIGAAVVLTANAQVNEPETVTERIDPLVSIPTPIPPVERPRVSSAAAVENGSLGTASIVMPDVVPIDLPGIELRSIAPLDNDVIGRTRSGSPDGIVGGVKGIAAMIPNGQPFTADQVDKPVVLLEGSPSPSYPNALRQAGITGSVIAQFVVDTTGRVIESSIRLPKSDHEQFAGSVRATLPRMRFLPAEANGRKVSQLVLLPFRFDLNP
jgi:protein TonB